MKFPLEDGTSAFLKGIVQSSDYRRDYQKIPDDAAEEIKRIAETYLPSSCWRPAPLLLIGANNENLNKLMRSKRLPLILCVGEFVSYRKRRNGSDKAVFLRVVWLQEEFLPYMNACNGAAFRKIEWNSYLPKTS